MVQADGFFQGKAGRRKKQGGKILSALLALCLLFASCGKEEGLFHAVVSLEGDRFSPKAAGFSSTVEEVLDACGLSEDAADYSASGQCRIIRETVACGLPVTEIFSFADGQLVAVEYVLSPDSGDCAALSQRLTEEAAAFLPEQLLLTGGGAQAGQTALWQDSEGNQVRLSFPETGDPDRPAILLQICAAKGLPA